jgi:hypothetical protein
MKNEIEDWRTWYKKFQEKEYQVESINCDENVGWVETEMEIDGQILKVLYREGAPFFIQYVRVFRPDGTSYDLPLPRRPEHLAKGYVALVADKTSDRFLVQARKEQGYDPSINHTIIGPAVQMSEYNYRGLHGGAPPQRKDWVDLATFYPVAQDGGMLLRKYNYVGFLELDLDSIERFPNERIFTIEELREAISEGLCADHLLQALGMWKVFGR